MTPHFRATLELLAAPARERYSWTACTHRPHDDGAFFVAAAGRDAVRLITDHQSIQLDPIPPRNLAAALVEALPEHPPARMTTLRIPTTYLEDTDVDPLSEMSGHADDLRHLLRAERTAVHKLHAAVGHGTDRVHGTALTVYDLARAGRVLAFTSDAPTAGWKPPYAAATAPTSSTRSTSASTDSPEPHGSQSSWQTQADAATRTDGDPTADTRGRLFRLNTGSMDTER